MDDGQVVIDGLKNEIEMLKRELHEYKVKLESRGKRIRFLMSGIRVLIGQMRDNNINPAFNADITFGREAENGGSEKVGSGKS